MAQYPEIQVKAQNEIDLVVGSDRLPAFSDRDQLPYVNAVINETLRYSPNGPIGLPHTCRTDDIYNGYFIPKGSHVFANIWCVFCCLALINCQAHLGVQQGNLAQFVSLQEPG
jgi:cytochrome P450